MDPRAAPAELTLEIAVQRDVEIVQEAAGGGIDAINHANNVRSVGGLQLPYRAVSVGFWSVFRHVGKDGRR